MQSSFTRKRKRQSENATMVALDLPDIPGVPLDVLPEFVHAIRLATKFYAKCHGRAYFGEDSRESYTDEASGEGSPGLLDSLMERMASATGSTTNPEEDELSKRRQAANDALGRWIESVKRFTKSEAWRRQKREQAMDAATSIDTKDSELKTASASAPYACFLYLWDLQQTHERIAVRRASLYLTGMLLQRSKDCRFHLEHEENLGQWLQLTLFNYHPVKAGGDLPFFQLEADFWLNYLVKNGYGRIYPKIQVALQRLRQRCPHLEAMSNDLYNVSDASFSSMNDLRRIRDAALAYGDKEIKNVEKWLRRADVCMEILVPRLVTDTVSASASITASGESSKDSIEARTNHIDGHENGTATIAKNADNGDDDYDKFDDEEDDIDWEDGCAESCDDGIAEKSLSNLEHFRAVERTLAAMEESAGGLRSGGIEIDFRDNPLKNADDEIDMKRSDAVSDEERDSAFIKLNKCGSVLEKTHKPRLTIWLEGLTNADNLVVSRRSLVSLPSGLATKRTELANRLAELLRSIAGVLSSAQKLRLGNRSGRVDVSRGTEVAESDDVPLVLRLSSSSTTNRRSGREKLLSTADRQRKLKNQGSRLSKIRIKFHPR